MANEPTITVIGNLTADPELRFTPSGSAVANFTIANTPRKFNRQTNEWEEQETLFVRCAIWRDYAENVAESLHKGNQVIAQGRLKARSYDDKEGNRRTEWELDVDELGPTLRFATAQVQRTGGQGGQRPQQGGQQRPPQNTGQPNPWQGSQQQSYDWGQGDAPAPF